jgi:DNA-binding transcriptional regulator GbsR (MarR family)
MELDQAKQRFIEAWGNLGESWGVGKRMTEIHALLLITPYPCSCSYISKQLDLKIETVEKELGNLIKWDVISKEDINNDGQQYFKAEKDVWDLAQRVAKERRERELIPILQMLGEVKEINSEEDEHLREFKKVTSELESFAMKADKFLNRFANSGGNWFFKQVLNWIK